MLLGFTRGQDNGTLVGVIAQQGSIESLTVIDMFITKQANVAQKMPVDLIMPAVSYPAHLAFSFTHSDVAAQTAVGANGRGSL